MRLVRLHRREYQDKHGRNGHDHHQEKAQDNAYLAQQTGNAIYSAFAVANARNYERAARASQAFGQQK